MTEALIAGIYVRSAANDPAALAHQERVCRAYADAHGCAVVGLWWDSGGPDPGYWDVFDDGSPVATTERPGLSGVRAAVARGHIGALLVGGIGVISRDWRATDRFLAELDGTGVWVIDAERGERSRRRSFGLDRPSGRGASGERDGDGRQGAD